SEALDRWQAALKADFADEVVIAAIDHPEGILHAMGPMGWNAHKGKGFAWVETDRVPEATRRMLDRRQDQAYMCTAPGSPDTRLEYSRAGAGARCCEASRRRIAGRACDAEGDRG